MDGVVYYTDCKVPSGKFVILGCINKTDLTRLDYTSICSNHTLDKSVKVGLQLMIIFIIAESTV